MCVARFVVRAPAFLSQSEVHEWNSKGRCCGIQATCVFWLGSIFVWLWQSLRCHDQQSEVESRSERRLDALTGRAAEEMRRPTECRYDRPGL
jgi:hypothetical protein